MLLLATEALQDKEIAERLGVDRLQVARWRKHSSSTKGKVLVISYQNPTGDQHRNCA